MNHDHGFAFHKALTGAHHTLVIFLMRNNYLLIRTVCKYSLYLVFIIIVMASGLVPFSYHGKSRPQTCRALGRATSSCELVPGSPGRYMFVLRLSSVCRVNLLDVLTRKRRRVAS